MTRWLIASLMILLLSCQMVAKKDEPDSGLKGYSPNAVETERAACTARGGKFAKAGQSGGQVCVEQTPDGGKSCTSGTQCDGMCLARSGTCSPLKPLYGCNKVLSDSGGVATVCID